jgi:methionyl-tRNA synthetase
MNYQYITTTLPYVNDKLHVGHCLEFARADFLARSFALSGKKVFFNTGTDEHGQKILESAQKLGISPQEYVDEKARYFSQELLPSLGILEDNPNIIRNIIRTTNKDHQKSAQKMWNICKENGFIYKKDYELKYCIGCELEKTDSELVDGVCLDHPNKIIEIRKEENYFFKLSQCQEALLNYYGKNPNFVIPGTRFNETKEFVKRGLCDFSISRLALKMSWGIPVSDDQEHVMAVWFDALTNYISALGWPENTDNFENFWKKGNPIQFCGKDNNRQQSTMWQGMLFAVGIPFSHQICINGYITAAGGMKMSKTIGNSLYPDELSKNYGSDALRFFLLHEISSFEDSPFSLDAFHKVYTSQLVNGIGNLTARIMQLSQLHLDKKDLILQEEINKKVFDSLFETKDMTQHVKELWKEVGILDKYIQETQAFKVIKEDEKKGKALIKEYVARLFIIATNIEPIIPKAAQKIKESIRENIKPESLFVRREQN